MAYKQEKDGTIIIKGFEKGVSDDPYTGISDIRNINLISIPTEASVNFSTSKISAPSSTGTMSTTSAANDTITISMSTALETGQAISFSVLSDTTKGLSLNVPYWVTFVSSGVYKVSTSLANYLAGTYVNITADSITGTLATYNMNEPRYFTQDKVNAGNFGNYWTVDAIGQVWTNATTAGASTFYWVYVGNYGGGIANNTQGMKGNGIVYYEASNGTGYIFVFRDGAIDYTNAVVTSVSWVYGWKPSDSTTGNAPGYLKNTTSGGSHEAILASDNRVYYCDANWIGRWYQTDPTVAFVPTTLSTYTFDQTPLLPFNDRAQCLAQLGTNIMVGGQKNIIYPWDRFSTNFAYPIFIAENIIYKMVTVNTNTFIFAGSRGRIYVTNGSQAQLYKKIPDHISGTVEPYFLWGGACTMKNQLYFSASVTNNAGTAINQYGGLWAIDLDTQALRLTNKLSYGTYGGYASALAPIIVNVGQSNPSGVGILIGWDDGNNGFGMDTTSSTPYTGGQATIDTDLIPIGTVLQPKTNGIVEFKLAVPLVSGESIKLQYRQKFSDSFTDISSTTVFNTAGIYSGAYQNVNFQNSQWIQIRAVLTSTASSPSFVRLTEIRLK